MKPEMVLIPGGPARVGSDAHYPEERPAREAVIPAFRLDAAPVSVGAFAQFVDETDYVTRAERAGGSMVFRMTGGPTDLRSPENWWAFAPDACWRKPDGPGSVTGEDAPVRHVALEDAEAFARWRGARLPTEWEWEAAARGGLADAVYAWGDEFAPGGRLMANIWTGAFPWHYAREGSPGPTPAGRFPANAYGLYDMIGNVWEWTSSPFKEGGNPCCAPETPSGAATLRTARGGSFLCAAEYCLRYRPAARIGFPPGATTAHLGFRCAAEP